MLQLREDFVNALATEAQMIVDEVARLGEERRQRQQCVRPAPWVIKSVMLILLHRELGQLMMMRAKYGPGGEFESEWFVPKLQCCIHVDILNHP
jgi:hypothetical protein